MIDEGLMICELEVHLGNVHYNSLIVNTLCLFTEYKVSRKMYILFVDMSSQKMAGSTPL
jgi:hypothetical protein